ncbi:hypothetical protein N7E81_15135 [Reichenbachiella carrageenanivorans]|uniref:Tetratricopeptide repeat-containing protein n=1 Tax=Reichenbachiella carrageenanivorans TaxID=2979869 RepID=A0ABY6D0U8_9BACT|nr:hypothetical protein [Reichenbachiella carrageenanivorans]UXX78693.1 hypothetical protein N7E81_15135 [Reichenbachiella carrageenanivorans]
MNCKSILFRSCSFLFACCITLLCQGCEKRFGNVPVQQMDAKIAPPSESVQVSGKQLSSFDINELIQYLQVHEQAEWKNTSEEELLDWLSQYQKNAELLELVSDFYLDKKDLAKALHYNSMAEDYGANTTEFYKKRASIYAALGRNGLAIDYINKAVMINGNDPDIYLLKGEVYLSLGDSISALKYKLQAFQQDSSRLDIARDLAFLYAYARNYDQSRTLVTLLYDSDYETAEINFLNVELYREEHKNQEANQLLGEMLLTGNMVAGDSLIRHFEQQAMYDSMIFYATQMLAQDSLNVGALKAKAVSFDHKGYYASALQYYQYILAVDSLNEEGLEGVRKVKGKIAYLRKLRERREAIPTFDFASPNTRNE